MHRARSVAVTTRHLVTQDSINCRFSGQVEI